MIKRITTLIIAVAFFSACSPKITNNLISRTPLQDQQEVVVIEEGNNPPSDAQLLGSVKVGDTGFTATSNGTYDKVLDILKDEARQSGGNVVYIKSHKSPDAISSIHRVEADVYYVEDLSGFKPTPVVVPEHPDYAAIYLYRTNNSMGALVSYDVYVNDTKVYKCVRSSCTEVKILEECEVCVWAKTEAKSEVRFRVEPGKDYFIECSVSMGAFVGRPNLKMIDATMARNEYNSIKDQKK